jgi:molybdopterin molybdotransferase
MSEPSPTGPFFDVRMRGFRDRSEVTDAIQLIDARVTCLSSEHVPVTESAARVLSEDAISAVAVPAFDRSAMDGYALRGEDTFGASAYNPLTLRIIGASMPGQPYLGQVRPGEAVRIMTGAPVPDGADAVLPAEFAEESAGTLRVVEPMAPKRHVGRRGEDVAPGQIVLHAGRLLRPQDAAILASIGMAEIPVVRRPRVAILITGNEILPAGSRPDGYRIVDSNSVMLAALVRRDGGVPLPVQLLADQRDIIREALRSSSADVILISGGTSVGQEDHAPGLVAELGELPIHGVAMRPASPTGIGFIDGRPVFLLPGNPVSCLCAYDFFAARALRRLGGRSPEWPYRLGRFALHSKIVSAIGRVDYVRIRLLDGCADPLAVSGASQLSTTTRADGFVVVPRDREGHAVGDTVDVYLYDLP